MDTLFNDGPRSLPSKFGQNYVSNNFDIVVVVIIIVVVVVIFVFVVISVLFFLFLLWLLLIDDSKNLPGQFNSWYIVVAILVVVIIIVVIVIEMEWNVPYHSDRNEMSISFLFVVQDDNFMVGWGDTRLDLGIISNKYKDSWRLFKKSLMSKKDIF